MVITTSVVLGTRETPGYVSYEVFDAIKFMCAINSVDVTFKPNTIRYFVPFHSVVERGFPPFQEYMIDVDDAYLVPGCTRRNRLHCEVWKHKTPNPLFDRLTINTYETESPYFLVLPNATYYHTAIYTDQSTSHLVYSGMDFKVNFSLVYVDPHDTDHTIWFSGKPKYRVEITSNQDFRGNRRALLRRAITTMLPRAFKLDTVFGHQ